MHIYSQYITNISIALLLQALLKHYIHLDKANLFKGSINYILASIGIKMHSALQFPFELKNEQFNQT